MVVWFSSVIVVFFFSGILVSLIVGVNPLIAKSNIINNTNCLDRESADPPNCGWRRLSRWGPNERERKST